jgi:hypothetical protein
MEEESNAYRFGEKKNLQEEGYSDDLSVDGYDNIKVSFYTIE